MRLRSIETGTDNGASARGPSHPWLLPRLMLMAVCVLAGTTTCYRPEIASGSLKCATTGKQCPDDFICSVDVCVRPNWDGGPTEKPAPMNDGSPDAVCLKPTPVPGCQQGSEVCDPVCQTGCGCGQKCSTNGRGSVACVMMTDGTGSGGSTCLLSQPVNSDPYDTCRPGSVCLPDCGEMTHCYDFCKSDADCPQSACSRRTSSANHLVCESPFVVCDPLDPAPQKTCLQNQRCYLLSPQPAPSGSARTVCACNGPREPGVPCEDSRDCFQGHVCPEDGIPGGGYCRRICRPSAAVPTCPLNSMCRPWGPADKDWGYCL